MDKYKINLIYSDDNIMNLNEIIIKSLKKELEKIIKITLKSKNSELKSNCIYLSLHNKEDE